MEDLIDFLCTNDELHKKYYLTSENCQYFLKRIFDEIATEKFL